MRWRKAARQARRAQLTRRRRGQGRRRGIVLDRIEKEFPVHGGQMSQGEGKDGFGSTDEIESECHFYHILI